MEDDSAPSDDVSLTAVLKALDDADCRSILRETAEPMTPNELIETCNIPKSTLYRKLELLSDASLLRERDSINPEGGRTTRYERGFDTVLISMDDDDVSVTVERPQRTADERLADIWSELGEEL